MSLPDSLPIAQEDWNQTPPAVQAVILAQAEAIRALRQEVERLQGEVAELQEQVGQNSTNSSRPPSSDLPGPPKRERTPSGRRPGGQPGHEGTHRRLKPVEEVKEVIPVKPQKCHQCGHGLAGEDPAPQRHQVTEIPPLVSETTEYQLHTLECPACGVRTRAQLEAGVPQGAFGPRLQAMVAILSGEYHLSKRQIEAMLLDFFGVELGLGSVWALEQTTSEALTAPVEQARAALKAQPVANVDETSWPEGKQKGWMWVAVTEVVTVFLIRLSRGAKVAKELLGETFSGVVGSDRWSGYNWVATQQRQICWAHLLRDFEALILRGGVSEQIGRALVFEAQQMFHLWHRVRDGTLDRASFQTQMEVIQQQVGQLLRKGAICDHPKTVRTCCNLLKLEAALWTFVRVEGVEPTNNAAERAVRSGVLWRKRSFGTQSTNGSEFVERMMTVVASLRQQNRNVLSYLTAVCSAAIRGENAPSLLPDATVVSQTTS